MNLLEIISLIFVSVVIINLVSMIRAMRHAELYEPIKLEDKTELHENILT